MLKLASRIAADGLELESTGHATSGEARYFVDAARAELRIAVANSPSILADNVLEFYQNCSGQMTWDLAKDCPTLSPVGPVVFVEHAPSVKWRKVIESLAAEGAVLQKIGVLLMWEEAEKAVELANRFRMPFNFAVRKFTTPARWFCLSWAVAQIARQGRTQAYLMPCALGLWLNDRGTPISQTFVSIAAVKTDSQKEDIWDFVGTIYPALLTVAFMNCKNVVRHDVTESEGPAAKWIRRMKAPTIRYHVLDINPMKEVLTTEGGLEHNGLKKALHICRGHFATYTEERPLFGRITGTFWKPAHVRGSIEHGAVVKDYRVSDVSAPPRAAKD